MPDMHWILWLAVLPAIIIYGAIAIIFNLLYSEKFENSKFARTLSKPMDAINDYFWLVYLVVAIGWFFILRNSGSEWSVVADVALALAHPIWLALLTFLVLVLVPIYALIGIAAVGVDGFLENGWGFLSFFIVIPMGILPYYLTGVILTLFIKK